MATKIRNFYKIDQVAAIERLEAAGMDYRQASAVVSLLTQVEQGADSSLRLFSSRLGNIAWYIYMGFIFVIDIVLIIFYIFLLFHHK